MTQEFFNLTNLVELDCLLQQSTTPISQHVGTKPKIQERRKSIKRI